MVCIFVQVRNAFSTTRSASLAIFSFAEGFSVPPAAAAAALATGLVSVVSLIWTTGLYAVFVGVRARQPVVSYALVSTFRHVDTK